MDMGIKETNISSTENNPWNSFVVKLTARCNLFCKGCWQAAGKKGSDLLDIDTMKKVHNFFKLKNEQNSSPGQLIVQYTGGEPFLWENFVPLIKFAINLGYKIRIQTNGILINDLPEEDINLLANQNIAIKISLDGWNRDTHGFLRPQKSFGPVVKAIRRITLLKPGLVGVKTVIHQKNFPQLEKMIQFVYGLGASAFTYNIFRPEGRGKNIPQNIDEYEVAKKLIEFMSKPKNQKYIHLLNGTNLINILLSKTKRVPADDFEFYIDKNGGIFPHQTCNPEEKLGSVLNPNLEEEFKVEELKKYQTKKIIPKKLWDYVKNNLTT